MRTQYRTLYIGHREVMSDPISVSGRIASFLGKPLDAQAMAAAVRPEFHRQRRIEGRST